MIESRQELSRLSGEELWRAAEALVEAASIRFQLKGRGAIPDPQKQALVEAVYRDPSMTEFLFSDLSFERH